MQNVSNIYRQLMEKPHWAEVSVAVGERSRLITKQGECITFGGVSILTGTAGGDGGYREGMLKNVKTSHSVFPDDTPGVGNCVAGKISVEMRVPLGEIPKRARIVPFVRLTDGTLTSEWLQKGVYYLDKRETLNPDSVFPTLLLTGYDAMLMAEKDYPPDTSLAWPSTDEQVAREIADYLGFGIDARTWDVLNKKYTIQYPSGYSCREVLGYIAAMYGANWLMTDSGELRLLALNGIPPETRYLVTKTGYAITFGGVRILV